MVFLIQNYFDSKVKKKYSKAFQSTKRIYSKDTDSIVKNYSAEKDIMKS